MTAYDLLQSCINDHRSRACDLHFWTDPNGEVRLYCTYGSTPVRSYFVAMYSYFKSKALDVALQMIEIGDENDLTDDEQVNDWMNIQCRGTYLGTKQSILELKPLDV